MKSFIILSLCIISTYAAQNLTSPPFPLIAQEYSECAKEPTVSVASKVTVKISAANMTKATLKNTVSYIQKLRCIRACQMKRTGVLANNNIDNEVAFKVLNTNLTTTKTENEVKDIVNTCVKFVAGMKEECIKSSTFLGCVYSKIFLKGKVSDNKPVEQEAENV